MSYEKVLLTTPVILHVNHAEIEATIVYLPELDSHVALAAHTFMEQHSGDMTVEVYGEVINPDGTSKLDANGHVIKTSFRHTTSFARLKVLGDGDADKGANEFKRLCLLTAIGEGELNKIWPHEYHTEAMHHFNLRTRIQNAAHAGVVKGHDLL